MIPQIETASKAEVKDFQDRKFLDVLEYVNRLSPFYQRLFARENISIRDIKSIDDISRLPITSKEDLQNFNDDFLCVPVTKVVDFASTSGTLGKPVTFGLTDADLDRLAYNEAISFACAGIKEGDLVQLMTTMDRRFMAGLAYFLGLRKLKAGVIRVGAGIPELQWDSILKHHPKYLITIPSFLLKMIEYAELHGIDYRNSSVEGVICIGEPLRNQDFSMNALSRKISERWSVKLFSTYASTEMSTAFTECEFQRGGHHHPELIIMEVLDDNNLPVENGQQGELTITTLGVEAMPLVRFKTGDIVQLYDSPCSCGRNTIRIGPVLGRKKQMIKYKGTTLYPPAMMDILNGFDSIDGYIIIISTNDLGTDEIVVKIVAQDASEHLLQTIKDHFRAQLRVSLKVECTTSEILNDMTLSKLDRKPVHLIDERK